MTVIVDQPAANRISVANFEHSIVQGVNIHDPELRDAITEEELTTISSYADQDGVVRYWGVRPGEKQQTLRKWEKIHPGDYSLFYFGKHRNNYPNVSLARILGILRSQNLAQFTWDPIPTKNGIQQFFECIYFVEEPFDLQVDIPGFNQVSGRPDLTSIREFNIPPDPQIQQQRLDFINHELHEQGYSSLQEFDLAESAGDMLDRLSREEIRDGDTSEHSPRTDLSAKEAEAQLERIVRTAIPDPDERRRAATLLNSLVRNSAITDTVLNAYQRVCQICSQITATPMGRIAEGAHVRALGGQHQGADHATNMLCLCPRCHRSFDRGGIIVDDHLQILKWDEERQTHVSSGQTLHVLENHRLNMENFGYHRQFFLNQINQ